MTDCTCGSSRPYLHRAGCRPLNVAPATDSQSVEPATAPGPDMPVETHASAGATPAHDCPHCVVIGALADKYVEQRAQIDRMRTDVASLRYEVEMLMTSIADIRQRVIPLGINVNGVHVSEAT